MKKFLLIAFIGATCQLVQTFDWDQSFYDSCIEPRYEDIKTEQKELAKRIDEQASLYQERLDSIKKQKTQNQRHLDKFARLKGVSDNFEQRPEDYAKYSATLNRLVDNAPEMGKIHMDDTFAYNHAYLDCSNLNCVAKEHRYIDRSNRKLKNAYAADQEELYDTKYQNWSLSWPKNVENKISIGFRSNRPHLEINSAERDLKENIKRKIAKRESLLREQNKLLHNLQSEAQKTHCELQQMQADLQRNSWSSLFNKYTARIYKRNQ